MQDIEENSASKKIENSGESDFEINEDSDSGVEVDLQKLKTKNAEAKKDFLGTKAELVLDIFPGDSDVDLESLTQKILAIKMEGVAMQASEIMPVFFGVKKIRIKCVVLNEVSVDDIENAITEMAGDEVQNFETVTITNVA